MSSAKPNIPTTQSALRWVKVSPTDPFEWSTSAPVINPSELGDNQVLIQNHAVSLNPVDYKMAAFNFAKVTLPAVTGYDVSGRIVAVGKGVKDFQVGDEVFGVLNMNSNNGGGALQQYSVGEADALAKKPANLSHADAATLGVAFLAAMDGLRQVNIDSSTSVFVPGGSGGVGHFAVQIAQIRGAKQVITSASKDGVQILQEQYKIKDVINHAKENVVDRVLELTQGQGVDVVYDPTHLDSSFEKSTKTVKEGGSWIVLGGQFAKEGSKEAQSVAERKAKVVKADLAGYWFGPQRAQLKTLVHDTLLQGAKWIEEGKLKPYINQTIKLEEAQNALDQIKQGKGGFGKIVVKVL